MNRENIDKLIREMQSIERRNELIYQNSLINLVTTYERAMAKIITTYYVKNNESLGPDKTIKLYEVKKMNSISEIVNYLIMNEVKDLMHRGVKEWHDFIKKKFCSPLYYYNNNLSLGMVTLNPDKIFSGEYKEYRADATGDNYKNGTMYVSVFTGRFEEIKKMNEYSYLLTLDDVGTGQKKGTERIENDLRYYSVEAVGFTDSGVFMLYTPDAPIENLPRRSYRNAGDNISNRRCMPFLLYSPQFLQADSC